LYTRFHDLAKGYRPFLPPPKSVTIPKFFILA
jgi:hypothetical protein